MFTWISTLAIRWPFDEENQQKMFQAFKELHIFGWQFELDSTKTTQLWGIHGRSFSHIWINVYQGQAQNIPADARIPEHLKKYP